MDETEFESHLQNILNELGEDVGMTRVQTFDDVGLMTRNRGLVVTLDDGSEFQITIVQRAGPDEEDEDED